jgi:hypothetical protein
MSALSVLLAMSTNKKKGPTWMAKTGNVETPVYTIKPGCPNQQHVVCFYEDENGVGGDECADALRYLVATKARVVVQRKLRGL